MNSASKWSATLRGKDPRLILSRIRELWREEAKLRQQKDNAQEQLRTAERSLASTMDKVRNT